MSGGGGSKAESGPPSWAVPYYKDYYHRAASVADMPYRPYDKSRVADMTPQQIEALNATANRARYGSAEVNAARGQVTDIVNGQGMGQDAQINPYTGVQNQYAGTNNPYLTSQIDLASQDITRNYTNTIRPQLDTAMARSGSFGNTGIQAQESEAQRVLADQLGKTAQGMRFADYGQQVGLEENRVGRVFGAGENYANRQNALDESLRNRQMQAIQMAPQFGAQDYIDAQALGKVGDTLQSQQQAYLDDDYNRYVDARNYPKEQLATIGQAFGANAGTSTTTQGAKGSKGASAAGGALAGAQMGSSFGPYGTAAGAVLGGAAGYYGGGK